MAELSAVLGSFDASKVEPNAVFEAIPAGDYPVIIAGSEMKPTSNGNGQYLELKLQIVRGEYQNRILFDRLNLVNANQKAVDIARGTLSAICRAVGVLTPNRSEELHGKPLLAVVKLRKRDDPGHEGEVSNEVKGYKSITQQAPTLAPALPAGDLSTAARSEQPW